MRRALIIIVAALLAAFAAGAWFVFTALQVAVDGTGDVRRGSFDYWLWISPVVKEAPVLEPCDEPNYVEWGRDGERSPYAQVTYASRASSEALNAAFAAFAKLHKCAAQCEDADLYAFTWTVKADTGSDCSSVNVELELNY